MIFGGFQKLTLLDFPETVACTLFTKGCNFLCPFCHNAPLVNAPELSDSIPGEEILAFLKKRRGILEGVCITGGEPLLNPDLGDFIKKARALGYKIKLDTNGSLPKRLASLIDEGLLDYVAMDVKNSFEKYPLTSGCAELNIADIEESIELLLSGRVEYEFRTTVASELHTVGDIESIAKRIKCAERYFIQNFKPSEHIIGSGLTSVDGETVEIMCKVASGYTKYCKNR